MTQKTLKVGLIQQNCSNNKIHNIEKSIAAIEQCANEGAKIIVLQELHNNIYFCQAEDTNMFDLAEPIPEGETCQMLSQTAKKFGVVLVGSIFEKRAKGLYHNTAVVFENDGSLAGIYRKMHIPDDPAFYEKFYFTPGDLGFQPIDTSAGRLGVLVCWDQWYPEAARLMAMRGADLLIYPTAIGWDENDTEDEQERQQNAWTTIQRSHAIANGLPVVSVNRVGFEPDFKGVGAGIDFWGSSFVAGQQGEIIAMATNNQEQHLVVEIDLDKTEHTRRIWPFFRDRRIDAYQDITKRFLVK